MSVRVKSVNEHFVEVTKNKRIKKEYVNGGDCNYASCNTYTNLDMLGQIQRIGKSC
jgi:hypothetical protein